MMLKVLLGFCAIVALVEGKNVNSRIVGGSFATAGQLPYQVSLQRSIDNYHFCGGTIISKKTVVTAAHCRVSFVATRNMRVMVGSNNLNDPNAMRYSVYQFIIHPQYGTAHTTADIGVVIIHNEFIFNNLVQPVALVNRIVPAYEPGVVASGWGATAYPYPPEGAPNSLKYLTVNVITHAECSEYSDYITGKLCTLHSKGNGICSGDSGGPLVTKDNELIGVVSSAFLCAIGYPDFFTDVYYYRDFVKANMK